MVCTNYTEKNTSHNYDMLAPNLLEWQCIAYGEVDYNTMIKLTSCCKLFQSENFRGEHENVYWKRLVFNLVEPKEGVDESKIKIIWKNFFCSLKKAEILVKKSYRDEVKKMLIPYSDFLSKCRSNPKTMYYNAFLKDSLDDFIKDCELSADQGFIPAQNIVGNFYSNTSNGPKAFKYFKLSAEQKNAHGQLGLGACYLYGYGVPVNFSESFNFYLLSANQGNSDAQWNVGDYRYYYNLGTNKDYNKAFEYYLLSANQGNAQGQWKVGECYRYGRGVDKDETKAFKFYELSAEQNNSTGLDKLAECYENGIGTKVD